MFQDFAKADPEKKAINRDELEQLFIACDQVVDEKLLDGLYNQNRPIGFDDFYEIIDALENEKDTDEQCILAFSQLAGGMFIYEQDMRDKKLSEEDIAWLCAHMDEFKGQESLQHLTPFAKQLADSNTKQDVEGQKKYDFIGLIRDLYE